ncbi:MAG TPA: glycosyltransferase family 4 protein [Solirubrobacterales bacterium]|nr:glycosyltransferase family 4 protein [Solirubrobacterales bacterium]
MTRIVMLLENNPYPQDVRVRAEAESLAAAGHAVTVLAPRENGQSRRELLRGVRVRRFRLPATPATPSGFVREYAVANAHLYWGGATELLRGADVVHFHNPPDTLFGVGFLARALGRKVVFDHHDLAPELFEAKFGPGPVTAVLRGFERLTFRSATVVIAANESHREVARVRGGVAAERVAVVRNGPPTSAFAAATEARGGVLADPQLLFLGSMESQDGVDELIGLLERLARDHDLPGAQLTLVGEGSRRAPLEAQALAAGVAERVRFTGRVPHAEVPALLAAADVCLDPAPCTDLNQRSTMIKIAEYMAARRAVVANPLLETQRTAGDAVAYAEGGDPASFAAQVARLAREPDRRGALGRRGGERAAGLGWDASERVLLSVYEQLEAA